MNYLLTGVLIGLIFGIPAGAVGAMTVQQTVTGGIKAGLLTGLGSSAADCLYAVIGVSGLTVVSDALLLYRVPISLAGAVLVAFIGVCLIFRRKESRKQILHVSEKNSDKKNGLFPAAFAVGITNPASILTFLFAFSYFNVQDAEGFMEKSALVAGIFAGTLIWWTALSGTASFLKSRVKTFSLRKFNIAAGILLCIFALIIIVQLICLISGSADV